MTQDGRYAGVIALGELYGFAYGGGDAEMSVEALIDREAPTLTRESSLEAAVKLFFEKHATVVPVLESAGDGRLVGVVDQRTVLRAYRDAHEKAREIARGHAA